MARHTASAILDTALSQTRGHLTSGRAHVPFALGEPDVTFPLHEILNLGE